MRYAVIILGLLGIIALPILFGQIVEQQRALEERRARLDREVMGTVERTAYNRDDFSVAYSYTPPESEGGPISTTQPVDPATYAALRPGVPVAVRYSSADPALSDIKGSRYDQTLQQRGRDHLIFLAVCAVTVLAYAGHLLAVWKGVLWLPERRRLRGGVNAAIGVGALLMALLVIGLGQSRDFVSLLIIGLLSLAESALILKAADKRGCGREGLGLLWFLSLPLVNALAPMPLTHPATVPAIAVMMFALMLADLLLRQTEELNLI